MAHLFQRGRTYYLKFYVAGKQKQKSLGTQSLQIAKEKKRQFESAQAQGFDNPLPTLAAGSFEKITPGQIADFIDFKVRDQGLKPKTANHYRSILRRVFNWASQRQMIRLPGNVNPASQVRPYKEAAPEIRFLTLPQIDEQLQPSASNRSCTPWSPRSFTPACDGRSCFGLQWMTWISGEAHQGATD